MNEAKRTEIMGDGKKCPQCGASLPAGALAGLCPACLLKQGATAETATQPEAAPFQPPGVEEVARLFPQLEILAFIGKGGMGAVYKARQPALDRLVALKILPSQSASGPGFAERFNREARALAKLNHPNIVTLYEFGTVGQASSLSPSEEAGGESATGKMPVLHYFIMEFVDGLNLRQLERAGKLSPREALQIVPQICEALQFAHDEGIVHRDIKPENILLDRKGRVKIADFGIAKIMGTDSAERSAGLRPGAESNAPDRRSALQESLTEEHVIGTPHYMAPEQVEKPQTVDHRADIYSLGVVFYEMLTGELPLGKFAPPSSRRVEVDVRLDEVVLRALEKEPELRYQQASQVKTAVETIAATPDPSRRRGEESQTESERRKAESGKPSESLLTATILKSERARLAVQEFSGARVKYPVMGEVALHTDRLVILSGYNQRSIPLADVHGLGEAVMPFWFNPAGHRYAAVDFNETGQRRRLVFLAGSSMFRLPGDTRLHAVEWLTAIQRAMKSGIGRDMHIAHGPTVVPVRTWWPIIWLVPLLLVTILFTAKFLSKHGPGSLPVRDAALRVKGPPFVARLNQGEVELLVIGNQPWSNTVCWLPNGALSSKPFPLGNGSMDGWADNMVMKKIAFRIHNETPYGISYPVCRANQESGVLPQGSGLQPSGPREPDASFIQIIGCPTNAGTMNVYLGIANGAWETAITLEHENKGLSGAHEFNSPKEGDWSATYNAVVGRSDVAINCNYTKSTNWASRMVCVDEAGKITVIPENSSSVSTLQTGGILLVSSNEFARIKEFQLQRRKYQWVEFRNVSLEAGHRTTVQVRNFGEKSTPAPIGQNLSFGPTIERIIPEPVPGVACVLDFETGQFQAPPDALARKFSRGIMNLEAAELEWLRTAGGDAVALMPDANSVRLIQTTATRSAINLRDLPWADLTAKQVADMLSKTAGQRSKGGGTNILFWTDVSPSPVALSFVTREGTMGALEILGPSYDPRGVKIRYKLVQNGRQNVSPTSEAEQDANQEIARLKLQQAEQEVKDAEMKVSTGLMTEYELQKVKLSRDIAAAEVKGDNVEVARLKLTIAELDLDVAGKKLSVGKATTQEYEQAKLARDAEMIRYKLVQTATDSTTSPASKPVWGEPVENVTVSLRADKAVWRSDEPPVLHARVRNGSGRTLHLSRADTRMQQVEVDGQWYRAVVKWHKIDESSSVETPAGVLSEIQPGEEWNNVQIALTELQWQTADTHDLDLSAYWGNGFVSTNSPTATPPPRLRLVPGKHTVRVAFVALPARAWSGKPAFRAISNPVELEIQSGSSQSK